MLEILLYKWQNLKLKKKSQRNNSQEVLGRDKTECTGLK